MNRIQLEKNWTFNLGEEYDEKSAVAVTVPHDWSTMFPINKNNPTGLGGGYAVAGKGVYVTDFTLKKSECKKNISVCFDGVFQNSLILLNGEEVGGRAYGYSTFEIDITDYVKQGKNTLTVKVDNCKQPNSRWYTGSGILRPVYLQIREHVHFSQFAVFAKTNIIDYENNTAYLSIETSVDNRSETDCDVYLKHFICDKTGKQIVSGSVYSVIESKQTRKSVIMPTVTDVHLWSAKSPYLYTLKSELYQNEKMIDSMEMKIGIREIDFDAKKGFVINNKREKIKGVCLHHDCGITGGVGYAETWRIRLEALKEMGCNGIRCAHNPPCIELLDICDELGFYVMDEAFDEWQLGKFKHHAIKYSEQYSYGYSQFFESDSEKDLTTMIHRDRNHPSIVLWSIGNEILEQSLKDGCDVAEKLVNICHREDSTRKTVCCCDKIAASINFGKAFRSFEEMVDVVGYNYADRWGERGELLYEIDHELFPSRCIIGSENYSAPMIRGDYSNSTEFSGFFRTLNYRYTTMQHEHLWKFTASRDYVAGDYSWTGIDYLGEEEWPFKGKYAAPIDCAGFKKDTFYYFKSIWNDEETTLHIAPHWNFEGDEGTYKQVIVYTNCKQVSLFCNGKLVSTKGFEFPHKGHISTWPVLFSKAIQSTNDLHLDFDVMYEKGELLAIGYDENLNEIARKTVFTVGKAKKLFAKKINSGKYVHVEVTALDADGNEVMIADNSVVCSVLKGGRFIAMESGDLSDHTLCASNERKLFAGKLLALFESDGELAVKFESENLSDYTLDCSE